ncbi:hypothetical protein PL11201_470123 [Planktothrix sp. PCC 11201]|nr:hypothetical protein PL11201_470123 [Planktothrix sp. PCC 11201]
MPTGGGTAIATAFGILNLIMTTYLGHS